LRAHPRWGKVKGVVTKSSREGEAIAISVVSGDEPQKIFDGVKTSKRKFQQEDLLTSLVKHEKTKTQLLEKKQATSLTMQTIKLGMSAWAMPPQLYDSMDPKGKEFVDLVRLSAMKEAQKLTSEPEMPFSSPRPHRIAKELNESDGDFVDCD
jgi:hypothetical protein